MSNKLQNFVLSLFFGLVYLFISITMLPLSHSFEEYLLLLIIPIPLLVVILHFSFWYAIVAFIPIVVMMICGDLNALQMNIFLTAPSLLVLIASLTPVSFSHGKYVPLIITFYTILLLLGINYYYSAHHLSFANLILDTIYSIVFQLTNYNPELLSTFKSNLPIELIAFFLPTIFALCFFLLLVVNYAVMNWLLNKPYVIKFNKYKIGPDLPKFYIVFFVLYLLFTIGSHYLFKLSDNVIFIVYNIATILLIPFLVSGMGVINNSIKRHRLMLLLFIILLFMLSLYLVIGICLLGFLKEAQVFKPRVKIER